MSINKNRIRFVIQLIGVLIIASLAVTGGAVPTLSNSGGGSWQYQRDITISNTGGVLSDYQVLVSLTSGNFPTNAQNSGADIRFTDISGAELSYWIESWDYSGRNAKIWVKVTSIVSGSTTIRMYYGNPSAISSSNGDTTFKFFDDFNDGTIDTLKWNKDFSGSGGDIFENNGKLTITHSTSTVGVRLQSKTTFTLPYRVVQKYSYSGGAMYTNSFSGMTDTDASTDTWQGNNAIGVNFNDNVAQAFMAISGGVPTPINDVAIPVNWRVITLKASPTTVEFLTDDSNSKIINTNIPTVALPFVGKAQIFSGRSGGAISLIYDYVFITNYISPEPTVTLGAEQPVSAPVTTGTITVTTTLTGATFTLTGASSYSGSGTSWSTTSAPAGTYTIMYGTVTGYNAPPSETKTLPAGGSITFSGIYTPTPIVTVTPTVTSTTVPPTTVSPTPEPTFRVGPSVTLRPVTDVIDENQDGIVELFMNNPSLNDVTLNVDAQVSVPAGLHVSGENFGQAAGAGVVAGTFSVPPGKARTISIAIKADKSARKGSHTIQFSGLYYPGDNKDAFQPISLTYSVIVRAQSIDETPTPIPTVTPGFSVILTLLAIVVYVISKKELRK